jgi:hypothetical protein
MKTIRRIFKYTALTLVALIVIGWSWLRLTDASAADLGALKRGDIVFQVSGSGQSLAIMLASKSLYSHVGIVDVDENGTRLVLEAVGPTKATPLEEWVRRGKGQRLAAYRLEGLTDAQAMAVAQAARKHFGKPYDLFFFSDEDTLYCSELVYLAFKSAINIELGQYQSIASLDLDNFAARKVIARRWERYPLCSNGQVKDADACLAVIKAQSLITPESVAQDRRLKLVFSNFEPLR